jgi:hypothetical protein
MRFGDKGEFAQNTSFATVNKASTSAAAGHNREMGSLVRFPRIEDAADQSLQ